MRHKGPRKTFRIQTGNSYPRLPRLPMEIIMLIISFTDELLSESCQCDTGTSTIKTNSEGFKVDNSRLLPQVILCPRLLKPHYVDAIQPTWRLKYAAKNPLKPSVLTDKRITKFMSLSVTIREWPLTRKDMNILRTLIERVPNRWDRLYLDFYYLSDPRAVVVPVLTFLRPCFSYITNLSTGLRCMPVVEQPPISSLSTTEKTTCILKKLASRLVSCHSSNRFLFQNVV